MTDHKRAIELAAASWIELAGVTQAYQAAVLRGDLAAADDARRVAHDLLDGHLDQQSAAAQHVRALLRR